MKKILTSLLLACSFFAGLVHAAAFPTVNVMFETGKNTLSKESEPTIKIAADFLKANAAEKLTLSGFVDSYAQKIARELPADCLSTVMNRGRIEAHPRYGGLFARGGGVSPR